MLMSDSILYCYEDASHIDPDRTKSMYLQVDNGTQLPIKPDKLEHQWQATP